MNYGMYLSASGVLVNMYRQDVFANNLANVDTVGFKRDLAMITQRDAEAVEEGGTPDMSDQLLDQLGGGAFAGPQRIVMAQSPLHETGGTLDLALTHAKQFFVVTAPQGQQGVRLTRDGRFTRDSQGMLVNNNGQKVLDSHDQPIHVPGDGQVRIGGDGGVTHDGETIAQVQVAGVADEDIPRLYKQGGNLLGWSGDADPRQKVPAVDVKPGFVEASGVDPIGAMMDVMAVSRAIEFNANMIKYHDSLVNDAVNTLGRVA